MENERGLAFTKWAKAIKKRDNYICQVCYCYDKEMHAHHMNSWDKFIQERYSLSNGICICFSCHEKFHTIYGVGNNTKFQFYEFREIVASIRKLVIETKKSS